MSKENFELPIKQIFEDLEKIPSRNPELAAQKRSIYLQQVASMRHSLSSEQNLVSKKGRRKEQHVRYHYTNLSVFQTSMAALLIVIIILAASATTVYASRESLPGDSLYPVKTFSEDATIALAFSTESRINYEMDFVDRRISEMQTLAASGVSIPVEVNDRLEKELDAILQYAAELEDTLILKLMPLLRLRSEVQLQAVDGLLTRVPESDLPAVLQAQTRIREQIRLCAMGESDPQGFRMQVRQRYQYRYGSGDRPTMQNGNGGMLDTPDHGGNGYGPDPENGQQGVEEKQEPGDKGNGAGDGQPTSNGDQLLMTPDPNGPGMNATQTPGDQKKGH